MADHVRAALGCLQCLDSLAGYHQSVAAQPAHLQPHGRFICNDFRSLNQACIAGLGIAQLPQPMALQALRDGRLKQVLPDFVLEGLQLFIHYPSRKQLPARVRAFVDFAIEHLGGHADMTADVSGFCA